MLLLYILLYVRDSPL